MAAGDDLATASDALSLHTIADVDVYAAQEQEDADFALALALEDEESQRLIQSQNNSRPRQAEEPTETFTPYHDDPNAEQNSEHGGDILPAMHEGNGGWAGRVKRMLRIGPSRRGRIEESNTGVHTTFPAYRDGPNGVPPDTEAASASAPASTSPPARARSANFRRVFKLFGKAWICGLVFATVLTFTVIGAILIAVFAFGKADPKERAWSSSHSTDYDLKLTELYPALEEGATETCKNMWKERARTLRGCHRMILSDAWDDGDAARAADADPYAYSGEVCSDYCRNSIRALETPMNNGCYLRTDRFDLINYGKDGKQYFNKASVEEGPIHVVKSLLARYDRLCARPPKNHYLGQSEWGTCSADLWMRWGIVDGKNEANMNGLETLLDMTKEKKTIEGGRRTGSLTVVGRKDKKKYDVEVPTRQVGPGFGETDCGYCTLDWLKRKMRSFEFGQMLDESGQPLGLGEFNERMHDAIKRCGVYEGGSILGEVHRKWEGYGWWCGRRINGEEEGPCLGRSQDDHDPVTNETKTDERNILHGMRKDDWPLPELRKQAKQYKSQKNALEALEHSMSTMPCSIWFNEYSIVNTIVPQQNLVHHLCSDRCRNAVHRIQAQHTEKFVAAAEALPKPNVFQTWNLAIEQVNQTCRNLSPHVVVRTRTTFCAPGYAALAHPEWILAENPPSRPDILSAFSIKLDELDRKLPRYPQKPEEDPESQSILSRRVAESICNNCAGDLLVGHNLEGRSIVEGFLDDEQIDGRIYTKTAKKLYTTCAKMYGITLSYSEKRRIWKMMGLDRYD